MANPTSNFNWQMPTSSDLVTDLPADFETFGQAVDTSLADLKGGTTGQVLSKASNTDMDFTWVAQDDSNAIQNAIVDAKGDLIAASANDTPARLAVGNNGETLVADSSTSTGLRYTGNYAAGKNKIINGDFRINQRSFTSNTTSGTFNFDRFQQANSGGTFTLTPQTFTPGAAPVAGYEGSTFLRGITASQSAVGDFALFEQKIEDVRTLAGSTAVVSFWAKAASGTPKIGVELSQNFGSGGSPSATVNTALGAVTLSTSWVRYSVSVAVPSLSGKTIGTTANTSFVEANLWVSAGSTLATRASSIGIQNNTFDIWGLQVEDGSVATAFQTATGTIQGELAACQRYYVRFGANTATPFQGFGYGFANSTSVVYANVPLPVAMRTTPLTIDSANAIRVQSNINVTISTIASGNVGASPTSGGLYITTPASLTAGNAYLVCADNNNTAYVGFSAEL
jgi:hypothetical protein